MAKRKRYTVVSVCARLFIKIPLTCVLNCIVDSRNPFCQRPKSLQIQLCTILSKTPEPKSQPKSPLRRLCQSIITNHTYKSKLDPVEELTRVAVEVLPHLIGVVNLRILACSTCCSPHIERKLESKHSTLLMHHVWDRFRAQLRRVEIHCPIELATHLQLPSSSQLSSLQKFSFRFSSFEMDPSQRNGNPCHREILSRTVVPFLKGHQRTLRDVSFFPESPFLLESAFVLDTSPILPCLQNMRPLEKIQMCFLFLSMEETPFNGLPALRAHRDSLKSLTLYFKTVYPKIQEIQDPSFFCQDWCLVDLPHLTNLTLITPQMSFSPSFSNYVHQFATSLVSLTIPRNLEFTYLDIKGFCKTLVEFQSLRHLNISLRAFSPSILAQFAEALPCLRSLRLDYKFICPFQDNRDYVPSLLPQLVSCQAPFCLVNT